MTRRARTRYPCRLLDDDGALHIGVELAEVVECTGLIEGLAVAIAWLSVPDWSTSRSWAVAVWGAVAVGPGHRRADRDSTGSGT